MTNRVPTIEEAIKESVRDDPNQPIEDHEENAIQHIVNEELKPSIEQARAIVDEEFPIQSPEFRERLASEIFYCYRHRTMGPWVTLREQVMQLRYADSPFGYMPLATFPAIESYDERELTCHVIAKVGYYEIIRVTGRVSPANYWEDEKALPDLLGIIESGCRKGPECYRPSLHRIHGYPGPIRKVEHAFERSFAPDDLESAIAVAEKRSQKIDSLREKSREAHRARKERLEELRVELMQEPGRSERRKLPENPLRAERLRKKRARMEERGDEQA